MQRYLEVCSNLMELVSKLFYLSPSASSKVLTFEKSWNPVIRCVCWKVILVRTGFVISIPGAVSLLPGRICKHFPFHWEISVEGWRRSPQLHLQENKCIVFLELLQYPGPLSETGSGWFIQSCHYCLALGIYAFKNMEQTVCDEISLGQGHWKSFTGFI